MDAVGATTTSPEVTEDAEVVLVTEEVMVEDDDSNVDDAVDACDEPPEL